MELDVTANIEFASWMKWMVTSNLNNQKKVECYREHHAVNHEEETGTVRTLCRTDNSRKVKSMMTEMMEGTGRKGRPCRVWIEDIKDW